MKGYLQMQDGTEHKVGDSWPQIECFRCGICCARYRPRVTLEEIGCIAEKLGISTDAFLSGYVRTVLEEGAYILQSTSETCPFLLWDKDGIKATCSIHSLRPKACRNWVPSLSRPECREGLARLRPSSELLLPSEMYPSRKAVKRLFAAVRNRRSV